MEARTARGRGWNDEQRERGARGGEASLHDGPRGPRDERKGRSAAPINCAWQRVHAAARSESPLATEVSSSPPRSLDSPKRRAKGAHRGHQRRAAGQEDAIDAPAAVPAFARRRR
jgi:hypothetical protein